MTRRITRGGPARRQARRTFDWTRTTPLKHALSAFQAGHPIS
jgi:hypothetical protein